MFWVLGFTHEAVIDAWQDARLADAMERAWLAADRPDGTSVAWSTSDDVYAFRWFVNDTAAALLDRAKVIWRPFVIGRTEVLPTSTRPFLPPPPDRP